MENEERAVLYANGQIAPAREALAPALEHGLQYGAGLFETMRAMEGEPEDWEAHWGRLAGGAAALDLRLPWTGEEVLAAVRRTLAAAGLADAAVRVTVSAGPGLTWQAAGPPGLYVLARPHRPLPPEEWERGLAGVTASFPRHSGSPLVRFKTLNYLESLLARREAKARGAAEAIFRNERGEICEASMANLFLVREGCLLTPPVAAGLLPGITRARVLALARENGIPAREERITPALLPRAEECFLTGSLTGVVPLTTLDGQAIGGGRPGPLTRRLAALLGTLNTGDT